MDKLINKKRNKYDSSIESEEEQDNEKYYINKN